MKLGSYAWSHRLVNIHYPYLFLGISTASALKPGGLIRLSCSIEWRLWLAYAVGQRLCLTRVVSRRLCLSWAIGRRIGFTRAIGQRLRSHPHNFCHWRPLTIIIPVLVVPLISIYPPHKESPPGRKIIMIFLPYSRIYAQFKISLPYSRLVLIIKNSSTWNRSPITLTTVSGG